MQIEKLLSEDNILENPRLLDMMDDNLSISIGDFLLYYKMSKNTVFKENRIIEVYFISNQELSRSKIFVFDVTKGEIQRREKGLRRIILFQEVHHNLSLKDFLNENGLIESIVKYDDSNKDYIKIYFNTEEETLDIIKKIEKIKWENVKDIINKEP